ncbi:hypothetical protein CAOG_03374 [Capsaspora owczarzaki ATCC 30864]|uniref:Mannosylglycerate hydrolase MGH1-like glycoside hydrolase domain-containing protein n=1 Tax=Capsaspora owczarzaki (strain ATCC 30864) TaxID=595528 RepID=A0A0D2UBH9_CAPO3|nr:hypothetical protein CAOG_03374 [Capsaspora owczarzaki ATCC 30864]KJE92396.1 hypothetical protein CAOG_003374 [Capsaspora owczarzaki ATCC 30864]|eukprot:XP_004364213.1 hypothetical protein CAOG_03374 [Capsaspora owczarzaki ATCC 30864]
MQQQRALHRFSEARSAASVFVLLALLLQSVCAVGERAPDPPAPPQNTSTPAQVVSTCYDFLESHLCAGELWGLPFHFYRPSLQKYSPDQWLWDSGSHMIVWSHRNVTNSILDLRTMLQMQQPDGRIPEEIFWGNRTDAQRLELLDNWSNERACDLTQMPVLPWSLRAIINATLATAGPVAAQKIAEEFLLPLIKYFRWWRDTRAVDGDDLVYVLHGWESGLDASPAYDQAYGIPEDVPQPPYLLLYPRFEELILTYKFLYGWNQTAILHAPHAIDGLPLFNFFHMKDVGVNSIYAAGWALLGAIAESIGQAGLAAECYASGNATAKAITTKMFDPQTRRFFHLYKNVHTGEEKRASQNTVQTLLPLLLPVLNVGKDIADDIIAGDLTNTSKYWSTFPVPTTSMDSPSFNPVFSESDDLMWRGPTWGFTNWFVIEALSSRNYTAVADALVQRWLALVEKSGIWEQYNPITGDPYGAVGLGMSTLIVDWLYRTGIVRD